MARKITAVLKLELPAGKATAAYPVGPALGPYGVNIMAFVKEYNAQTVQQAGLTIPVEIVIYGDRSFSMRLLAPTAASLLRQAAGIAKGASNAGRNGTVGTVTRSQLRVIAQTKLQDLNTDVLEQAEKIIAGTARSMGIAVVGE
jgi:large subunit ribosomal protein L11